MVEPVRTYEDIPGFFDFGDLYDSVVSEARPGAVLVEVGCYHGRSLAYLGGAAVRAVKGLRVYGVEHGLGGETVPMPEDGEIAARLVRNVRACGLLDAVHLLIMPSVRAAGLFEDSSVDFVFVDAEHTFRSVLADLDAWWPKVRPGGLIAGHDYAWPEVARAVHTFFGRAGLNADPCPQCWAVRKPAVTAAI